MYHRLDEWQLSRDAYYSTISDSDLDDHVHVREIKIRQNPIIGEAMLMAALKVHNVWVQRTRLQASIHRVHPHTTVLRKKIQFEGECTQWMVQTAYGWRN